MISIKSKMKVLKNKIRVMNIFLYLCLSKASVFAGNTDKGNADKEKEEIASALKDTKAVKGTIKLFNDATTAALLIAPAIGIVLGVYFHIRKSAADEQDQKLWDKRIHTVIFCVIAATVFTSVLKTILTYYN